MRKIFFIAPAMAWALTAGSQADKAYHPPTRLAISHSGCTVIMHCNPAAG